tara:strand:+ start:2730 stop:2900 length:171 start_codon:yes stop_codon:yes gene_type:complete
MIANTNGKILKRLFKRGFAIHPDNKEEIKCNKNCKNCPLKEQVKNLSKIKIRTSNN